jgi:hypothetical protein
MDEHISSCFGLIFVIHCASSNINQLLATDHVPVTMVSYKSQTGSKNNNNDNIRMRMRTTTRTRKRKRTGTGR